MTPPLALADQIAAHLATTDIDVLELTGPDGTLRLLRQASGVVVADAPAFEPLPVVTVHAPGPGVFLPAHPMRAEAAAPLNAIVAKGDVLGFLRIGPLLMPVTAPVAGSVVGVLATDGATLGYGTPLFELEPPEETP